MIYILAIILQKYFIMPSTQELVILTNFSLASITLVARTQPSPFIMHNKKPEKFNRLNFEK
jgi:hypothetical protein